MTERYKMVTLEDNEDITSESYGRACDIGATLRRIYSALPRGEPERLAINDTVTPPEQWRDCSNNPGYTEESQERIFSSSYDFVNRLRWNASFTGYSLANVLNSPMYVHPLNFPFSMWRRPKQLSHPRVS